MKRWLLLLVLGSLLAVPALAEPSCVYYFYGEECPECQEVDELLSEIQQQNPDFQLWRYEVYHDAKNFLTLQDYYKAYNVEESAQLVPIIFAEKTYLVGADSIKSFLQEAVAKGGNCPSVETASAVGLIGQGSPFNVLGMLTFSAVTGEAIRNMFAPGIIAIALLLLGLISLLKNSKTTIKEGILYILGVYLAYLLFGFGLFDALYKSDFHFLFYKIIGFIAVLFGLAGIKAFFGTWKWLVDIVPKNLQRYLRKVIHFVLSPVGMFLVGFVTSLFTFASVGKSYFLMRSLITGNFMRWQVLPLMLYYSLVVVLILVAVLLLFNLFRYKMENYAADQQELTDAKKETWKKHYVKIVNLSVRLFILIVGVALIFV